MFPRYAAFGAARKPGLSVVPAERRRDDLHDQQTVNPPAISHFSSSEFGADRNRAHGASCRSSHAHAQRHQSLSPRLRRVDREWRSRYPRILADAGKNHVLMPITRRASSSADHRSCRGLMAAWSEWLHRWLRHWVSRTGRMELTMPRAAPSFLPSQRIPDGIHLLSHLQVCRGIRPRTGGNQVGAWI